MRGLQRVVLQLVFKRWGHWLPGSPFQETRRGPPDSPLWSHPLPWGGSGQPGGLPIHHPPTSPLGEVVLATPEPTCSGP